MTQPTQTRHPGRAVYRTVVAVAVAIIGLLPLLPVVADTLGLTKYGWAAAVLTAAAGITRVLAIPGVEAWMHKHLPDLAAQPPAEPPAPPDVRADAIGAYTGTWPPPPVTSAGAYPTVAIDYVTEPIEPPAG